ncbi:hypothetical protein EYF80_002676 [Liparis tanakae]|uniref:Uncharacterized protein n=1 Tax=Liparis tanakae TaxID=230148 RepID=A0A4Z2JAF0_9TELE|nr:hypothetical protein EYF80_002676 [Liparis tanakae]
MAAMKLRKASWISSSRVWRLFPPSSSMHTRAIAVIPEVCPTMLLLRFLSTLQKHKNICGPLRLAPLSSAERPEGVFSTQRADHHSYVGYGGFWFDGRGAGLVKVKLLLQRFGQVPHKSTTRSLNSQTEVKVTGCPGQCGQHPGPQKKVEVREPKSAGSRRAVAVPPSQHLGI